MEVYPPGIKKENFPEKNCIGKFFFIFKVRRERRYGSMARTFSVANSKQEEVSAKFENGILSINLPKKVADQGIKTKIQIS